MAKKRVTALLTLLLSLVLILPCFVGCGNSPKEKDCPKMVTYDDNFIRGSFFSYCPPKTFTLALRNCVDFECRVIGDPFIYGNEQKVQTIRSGESLLIKAEFSDQNGKAYDLSADGYVTIIAKESDHIVGYAVLLIEPYSEENSDTVLGWQVSTLKAIEFPRIFFSYQEITEEYVQEQFQKLIKQ